MKAIDIFARLNRYANEHSVVISKVYKEIYYKLLLYAVENGELREEGYCIEASFTEIAQNLNISRSTLNNAVQTFVECGLFIRDREWVFPMPVKELTLNKVIYEDLERKLPLDIEEYVKANDVFERLNRYADEHSVIFTRACKDAYYKLLLYAVKNGELREEGYCIKLSLNEMVKKFGLSFSTINRAMRTFVDCGLFIRDRERDFPMPVKELTLNKVIYEDWRLDEVKRIQYFTTEEKLMLNSASASTPMQEFSRGVYLDSLKMSRENSTEEYVIDLLEGLISKIEAMSDADFEELKRKLPLDVEIDVEE